MSKGQTMVPKLRFSEFTGEWNTSSIEEQSVYTKGFAFKSSDYQKEGVRIVRVSDLGARSIKQDNEQIAISEDKAVEFTKWQICSTEIIVTTVGSRPELLESAVGRAIFITNNDEGLLNQNLLKLTSQSGFNSYFTFSQLNTPRYINHISSIKRGNANQANITVKDLLDFKVKSTSLPEQEKIAAFLSSVDSRIEQLQRKKSLLQDYKKGVMSRLFASSSAECEVLSDECQQSTEPTQHSKLKTQNSPLRFKDDQGNPYPDWQEKKLGEVATVNPKTSSLPEEFFYIDLESVNDGQLTQPEKIALSEAPSRAQRKVATNDILYQMVRPYQKNNLLFALQGHYVASTGFAQLRATKNSSNFLYQLLLTDRFTNQVLKRCTGTSYPAINSKDLADIDIKLPTIPEQTKIASFLSTLDTKIEQVTQQITQTQTFKKGLLQQMFV